MLSIRKEFLGIAAGFQLCWILACWSIAGQELNWSQKELVLACFLPLLWFVLALIGFLLIHLFDPTGTLLKGIQELRQDDPLSYAFLVALLPLGIILVGFLISWAFISL